MKILVTGGAGYIGSHTVQRLVEAGEQVIVLDNLCTGHRSLVPQGVTLVEGDIANKLLTLHTLRQHDIEAVIHFAAHTRVDESVRDPLKYYENNSMGTLALLSSCVQAGVDKFIFSSTAAVYGITDQPLVNEESPTSPASPYGASKLMSEQMLADVAVSHHSFRFVALRYFNVAGARIDGRLGQMGAASHLIKAACEAACGNRPKLIIHGTDYPTQDGTGVRDYIHVDDLAFAHIQALKYLEGGGASVKLNCGYGRGSSVRDVIDTVKRLSGVDFPVEMGPRRSGDVASMVADAKKVRALLGWTPQYDSLEVICRTALDWERKLLLSKETAPQRRVG